MRKYEPINTVGKLQEILNRFDSEAIIQVENSLTGALGVLDIPPGTKPDVPGTVFLKYTPQVDGPA